jgi:hypothetical protein
MQFNRVLVVHSFADKGTEARIRQIESNPTINSIEFSHISMIDRERGSKRIEEMDRLADERTSLSFIRHARPSHGPSRIKIDPLLREVIDEEVKPLLLSTIEDFRPDLLIIHGGTIFTAAAGPILQVLIDIREIYPNLTYALEGKSEWLTRTTSRDYNPLDRMMIKNQVRWVKDNFVTGPEVDALIDEIF